MQSYKTPPRTRGIKRDILLLHPLTRSERYYIVPLLIILPALCTQYPLAALFHQSPVFPKEPE